MNPFKFIDFSSELLKLMKNFRKHFPAVNSYTYLNTASSGLLSQEVLDFRQDHDLDLLVSGSTLREKQDQVLASTREAVGRFFTCSPNRVALIPNFSYGFNTLMEGVDSSRKVLLLEDDYPSINWAVESREFKTCYAGIDGNIEENIAEAVRKHRPDIFAFSLVQYISGIRIEQDFLKNLKADFPDLLLFGDGTQLCGAENFDFEASAIDVLGASAYKWLNAGFGNAFFLFKGDMEGQITPRSLGFNSLQGKYKPHEGSFIGKFEPGHQDTLNFGSLLTAIELAEKIGMSKIEEGVRSLSLQAREALSDRKLMEPAIAGRRQHSSIFNIKGDDSLFRLLGERNIIISQRGKGIRLSFHYFNTSSDLQRLLEVLDNH